MTDDRDDVTLTNKTRRQRKATLRCLSVESFHVTFTKKATRKDDVHQHETFIRPSGWVWFKLGYESLFIFWEIEAMKLVRKYRRRVHTKITTVQAGLSKKKTKTSVYLTLKTTMNWRDAAEVEEPSEPGFTKHAVSADVSTSRATSTSIRMDPKTAFSF